MYIKRNLEDQIQKNLFKGDIVIIYGARQVGKTTLVNKILDNNKDITQKYFNCDEGDIRKKLTDADTSVGLRSILGDSKIIVIDEAQRIPDIGLKLKLLVDTYPEHQIIATGSSSFDLANKVKEPLTGRSREFWLYPLNINEINKNLDNVQFSRELETILTYGSYPAVFQAVGIDEKKIELEKIVSNYLYSDILKFENIKNPDILRKLLEALALQIGGEVSYNELSNLLGISKQTVENYVQILEKAYVVFRITPFSRNLRKEIGKLRKIYFYDLGVRNAIIDSLKSLNLRNDIGALWENFVIAEMRKESNSISNQKRLHFWRTYGGAEVDLVEEVDNKIYGYEIKWNKLKKKAPKLWTESYKDASWEVINKDNFLEVIKNKN